MVLRKCNYIGNEKGVKINSAGKVVVGTVAGDLHDIGKNLVAMMLEGGGFEVVDVGVGTSWPVKEIRV